MTDETERFTIPMKAPPKAAKTPKKRGKTAPRQRGLTVRQERFCEFIVAGRTGTDAWLDAGYEVSRSVARTNAAESLANPRIQARIAALRAPQTKKALLTKDRKRELMRDIAESTAQKTQDRLRAMELDAKLAGDFAPDQVVVETGPKTLEAVRERAKLMASPMSRAK